MIRKWFSKIESRDDALSVIGTTSIIFFVIAGLQIALAVFLAVIRADNDIITSDALFGLVVTAIVIVIPAAILRLKNSRIAAALLLVISIFILVGALVPAGGAPKNNLA